MSNSDIITINHENIHTELKEYVRKSVEETLNSLLDDEAERLVNAERYARSGKRRGYRSGHYTRKFTTTSGEIKLQVPKLKQLTFETAIIERYRRRESSVEEALIEMYLAGVSVRRVEDISQMLWGDKVSPGTISNLNKKAYENIEKWRNRSLSELQYPYVFVDGIFLKRCWGGQVENISVLIAIGVNSEGHREILGAAEGLKEDFASWRNFLIHLKKRGLSGVRLFIGDKHLGLLESINDIFGGVKYQRCTVHFYRNVLSAVPRGQAKLVTAMLKAIHSQEDFEAAKTKSNDIINKLKALKLTKAAKTVADGIDETLTYMLFPSEHWRQIRTNNTLERLNREVKRRTRSIGAFPDGESALMLVCARLRYVAGHDWGERLYLNMKHLMDTSEDN